MSSRGPVWDSRPGRGLSVGQPSGRDIFRTVATAPCRLRLTVAKRSPASKPEAMSAGSSGVGHVLSSDGHFGHPGLRSLRVRCALPSLASLAFTARSRTRATPSPSLPPGARGGRSPRRVPCPRRTSKNIRQLETTIPQRPRTRSPGGATGGRRAALVAGGMDAPATLKPAASLGPLVADRHRGRSATCRCGGRDARWRGLRGPAVSPAEAWLG